MKNGRYISAVEGEAARLKAFDTPAQWRRLGDEIQWQCFLDGEMRNVVYAAVIAFRAVIAGSTRNPLATDYGFSGDSRLHGNDGAVRTPATQSQFPFTQGVAIGLGYGGFSTRGGAAPNHNNQTNHIKIMVQTIRNF